MFLLCLLAHPKVLENVVEADDKEMDSTEDKTAAKSSVKEEVETPELKVPTA